MADAKSAETKKRKLVKGRHLSAIKRHRQNLKHEERNLTVRSLLKSISKKVRTAISQKDGALAKEALRQAMSGFDKAAKKGVIHRKNASRHIARLSKLVHKLAA